MARQRVLVVEDSLLIVTLLEEVLGLLDLDVVGPAGNLDDALRLAREAVFDIAVLDINLHDELVFPVADVLVERSVPFFFSSGYAAKTTLPERFVGQPLLPKPYEIESLMAMIQKTIARIDRGSVGAKFLGK